MWKTATVSPIILNGQGYPTAKGDSSGLSEQYTYAENGVDPVGLTTENGNSYSAAYDSLHRLTGVTDPNKNETVTTTYTYDAWGNVVKSTSACASEVMVTTAEYSSSTAFLGAPIRETAADGTVTEYIYNNRGQLLCVYSPQLQRGTLYYYNDYGQLLRAVTATKQYGDYTPSDWEIPSIPTTHRGEPRPLPQAAQVISLNMTISETWCALRWVRARSPR